MRILASLAVGLVTTSVLVAGPLAGAAPQYISFCKVPILKLLCFP